MKSAGAFSPNPSKSVQVYVPACHSSVTSIPSVNCVSLWVISIVYLSFISSVKVLKEYMSSDFQGSIDLKYHVGGSDLLVLHSKRACWPARTIESAGRRTIAPSTNSEITEDEIKEQGVYILIGDIIYFWMDFVKHWETLISMKIPEDVSRGWSLRLRTW